MIEGPAVRYVLPDANGNVGQFIDAATNAVAAHYEYDPFGNVTYASGVAAEDNPFRFSTKYHDDETNLVYYGYRYYSPELGRWLTRDPVDELGAKVARYEYDDTSDHSLIEPNPYVFVLNDPLNRVDLFGLFTSPVEQPWISGLVRLPSGHHQRVHSGRFAKEVRRTTGWTCTRRLVRQLLRQRMEP